MKLFSTLFIMMIFLSCQKEFPVKAQNAIVKEEEKPVLDLNKTKEKAIEALQFSKDNKLSTDFCILIDMSLHSGVNRFVVWNFKEQKVTGKYLVGHGCGDNSWSRDESKDNPTFSNEDGSHLSSLGKYKLSGRGYSDWGIHVKYLMHGMEKSNNNALKRFIVFHSWNLMSDEETFPKGSPEGWGCPTISNNAMRAIDPMIQNSQKPVLMWIYQ
ncbi:murein L,D-transpeptidase catalytic domain family protein [Chryseobacterium formosus]|uniref:Murein L,D-transpeptidase catalytic domain family protein n=1 Tax=Chryseobacterium formosus TaxID=1537363 RepID=A0ABT3XUI5_9FLAO|nr:murein L,D-transpeptidase catalytic domain family protein [Chryseobacterium formosus]MCX8525319.1 murein L,D-transpeptidase catalytic domain family protein [Chryseobacterium formosus]